jgi:hypothetical protein
MRNSVIGSNQAAKASMHLLSGAEDDIQALSFIKPVKIVLFY